MPGKVQRRGYDTPSREQGHVTDKAPQAKYYDKTENPNSVPRVPNNWTSDGLSTGKATGAVRKSPDAQQGPRDGGQSS